MLVLLAGAAAAFAVTERLKLEPAALAVGPGVRVFSPSCSCETRYARIDLNLREGGRVRVEIVDDEGTEVRRLPDERVPAGRYSARWNGRDDAGELVAEGLYRPRVTLLDAGRTYLLPVPLRLDVTAPRVRLLSARPRTLSPDGDGRRDRLVVRYRVGERARPELLVDGRRAVRANFRRRGVGELNWWGRIGGERARPGRYRVALVAADAAGNRSAPLAFRVRVR